MILTQKIVLNHIKQLKNHEKRPKKTKNTIIQWRKDDKCAIKFELGCFAGCVVERVFCNTQDFHGAAAQTAGLENSNSAISIFNTLRGYLRFSGVLLYFLRFFLLKNKEYLYFNEFFAAELKPGDSTAFKSLRRKGQVKVSILIWKAENPFPGYRKHFKKYEKTLFR